jgi:hypothetical protein
MLAVDRGHNLRRRDDVVEPPAVRVPHVHVLDEAHHVAGAPKVARELDDGVLVEAALDDDVHLHGQAGRGGCVDTVQHARDREVDVVHGAEDVVVERVERDGDPAEARVGQRARLHGQQRAVRRQRQVEPVDAREQRDQLLEVPPHQRLAARDADLLHAQGGEGAGEALDLLEGEQLGARQEAVVAAEDLLRHAVDAAEVAAVGDRDAQVAERPAETVGGHAESLARVSRGAERGMPDPPPRKETDGRMG